MTSLNLNNEDTQLVMAVLSDYASKIPGRLARSLAPVHRARLTDASDRLADIIRSIQEDISDEEQ